MKLFKKTLCIVLSLLMLAALAACASPNDPAGDNTSSDPTHDVPADPAPAVIQEPDNKSGVSVGEKIPPISGTIVTPPESDPPKLEVPPWDDTDSVQAKGDIMEALTAAGLTEDEAAQVDSVLQAYFSIHAAVLVGKSPEDSELIAEDVADVAFKWATGEREFWNSRIVGCLIEYVVESVQIDPDTGEYVLAVREYIWEHYNRSDTAGTVSEHEFTISKTDSGTLCMTKQSDDWLWWDEWR